jgi:hypothetical protein
MQTTHPKGYWVQQLTDDQIRDLLEILVSKKKVRKFNKVINQTRTDDSISIFYTATKLNSWLTYAEGKVLIEDYKISGGHSYIDFYEFMIENFGEEYANDLLAHADKFMEENPEDKWAARYKNIKKAVPAMLDSHNHNMHNDI